jgi:cullin-associated NEDD8-dissociated protein 1
VPAALPQTLIPQIKLYISASDISLLSHALQVLTLLLEHAPSVTFPIVEKELLSDLYKTAHSSLISGTALDNLMSFFGALVKADNQISTRLVPNLVLSVEKAPNKAENNPANVARCIGYIVQNAQGIAAGTIAEYSKNLKVRRIIHF